MARGSKTYLPIKQTLSIIRKNKIQKIENNGRNQKRS